MSQPPDIAIRALSERDHAWANRLLDEEWGSRRMVARGVLFDVLADPGFVAWCGEERVGIVTYQVNGAECEIQFLHSLAPGSGAGSALIAAAEDAARAAGCARLWVITTNDNLHAIGFYQKRGFELVAVRRHALEESRRLKPEIPLIGMDGIPLRDEIELEKLLR
jgi:GNAT superfamily N-acetyltransferase